MHQILLKHSKKDVRHRGVYKTLSNNDIANYPDGIQRVLFNTTEPNWLEIQMRDLVKWTNTQLTKQEIHPLLTTGTFVYEEIGSAGLRIGYNYDNCF